MRILVTGSSGHLGEALMRTLPAAGHDAIGLDVRPSTFTHAVGSITDRAFVQPWMHGADAVLHTATLHKPHVATHSRQEFIDVNVSGTLALLEAAVSARVRAFVFTSTTSAFGGALVPPVDAPAAWITEDVVPVPKNIYGVTKVAAENLCELVHRTSRMPASFCGPLGSFPRKTIPPPRDRPRMFPSVDRVYVNTRARYELGWMPKYDFAWVLDRLATDQEPCSDLARAIGSKGYHAQTFADGPYPVERVDSQR